ncbi:hypothetical protein STEG23_032051 [Scotinomys teguina]
MKRRYRVTVVAALSEGMRPSSKVKVITPKEAPSEADLDHQVFWEDRVVSGQANTVIQSPSILDVWEKETAAINCTYINSASSYFLWYKKDRMEGLTLLANIHSNVDRRKEGRFTVILDKNAKHISAAAMRAWKALPNKASGEQLSKVIQGPSEPFSEFVDRLLQLAGKILGNADQAMPIDGEIPVWVPERCVRTVDASRSLPDGDPRGESTIVAV